MKRLLGFLVAIWAVLAAIYFFSRPDSTVPDKAEGILRIAAANLHYTNISSNETAGVLSDLDIDVLVLFEWTGRNLKESMMAEHGYTKSVCEADMGTHGICVFHKTRLPVDASIERAPVDGSCNMPYVTVRYDGDRPIGIKAIHPPPPIQACRNTNLSVLNYHASTIENGRIREPEGALESEDLAVVMGDFNALASWKRVRQFGDAGMVDTFYSLPQGLSPTWSPSTGIPAVARIDYIWASQELYTANARTLKVPGSDHRAVVVDIIK